MSQTSTHRADRPRRSGRLVLAVLALLGAAVVLVGGQGTFAYWNDQATVTGDGFSSGTLDLTVDGQQGNPTAYVKTDLALSQMLPGESVARTVTVANAGDVPFTWVPSVTKGGGLGPALTVELWRGATASSTTAYPRTGSCTGGTLVAPGGAPVRLAQGGEQSLCVKVSLPANTLNGFQGKTGSVTLALTATQALS